MSRFHPALARWLFFFSLHPPGVPGWVFPVLLGLSLSGMASAEPVVQGIEFPVSLAFAPDGRLFFTERFSGKVRVVESPASKTPRLVPEAVYQFGPVSGYFERGLLGLALDPDFGKNGFLYVYYSHRGTDPKSDPYRHRLMRITVRDNIGHDPVALLDDLPIGSAGESGRGNHNGGTVAFGPDGKLYVTIGDMAVPALAQDLMSFAGKILRLNPDGTAPSDNPFYDSRQPRSPRSYVFALGLRNSFDFTFHPVTGALYATENGPESNDEINLIEAGKNYGWGPERISGNRNNPRFIDPLYVYERVIAPTGIAFYTGNRYPAEYKHNLFVGDWNHERIRRLILDGKSRSKVMKVDDEVYRHTSGLVDLIMGPDGFTLPIRGEFID
jgi:aldose sugar dehydrogenase